MATLRPASNIGSWTVKTRKTRSTPNVRSISLSRGGNALRVSKDATPFARPIGFYVEDDRQHIDGAFSGLLSPHASDSNRPSFSELREVPLRNA